MKVEAWHEGEWRELVVPPIPGYTEYPAIRVEGRLLSTARGQSHCWLATGFEIPSGARYEPRISLEFQGGAGIEFLGWRKPASLESVPRELPGLSWGGSLVAAPATVWGHKVKDLSYREVRGRLIEAARKVVRYSQVPIRQGHLEVYWVALPLEGLATEAGIDQTVLGAVTRYPWRPVVLFNHAVFVNRVVGYDNWRLIEIGEAGGVITSPSHPLEPIRLAMSTWLLHHPFPGKGD